jgi:hypothetical protein
VLISWSLSVHLTIVVVSLDDSDDEDYIEEPLPLAKRRWVRFLDTVRYAPDGAQ